MAGTTSFLKSAMGRVGRSERRETERAPVQNVSCDRGRVVDLSTRGMRVTSARRWREGQRRLVSISNGDVRLSIEARCIWCRQDGMFSHAIGLAFDDPSEEQQAVLREMAAPTPA
ncbi:MAG: PilZ domain-containing protein [Phycisphaerales bacterium]|nr:PilZ domain-containing protein [Phycisphaerales bacterium]